MTGTTFLEALRRHWRGMIYWGIGLGILGFIQIAAAPSDEALRQLAELYETMPPIFLEMFGGDMDFMMTPDGYLATQYFSFIAVVFAVYAVSAGLNLFANDEDRGILDVVMSQPVPRWQYVTERFLAYGLMSFVIVSMMLAGLWLGTTVTPEMEFTVSRMAEASYALVPFTLLLIALTAFATALIPRKGLVTGLATVFVAAAYFITTLGAAAPDAIISVLRPLSPFTYYDGIEMMDSGLIPADLVVMTVAAVILLAGTLFFFQRRDLRI